MYGIVWYYHREIGKNQLQKIAEDYLYLGIRYSEITSYPLSITFENGDVWRLLQVGNSARGYRCNISFVERCISEEDFNTFICPATMWGPYRAYNFYGEGELNVWNINY